MTLKVLLIIVPLIQLSASSIAQRITLEVKDAPLAEVIEKLHAQTGYDFLFTTSAMKSAKPVSINIVNGDLRDVLQQIFETQPLTFTIEGKSVMLSKINIPQNNPDQDQQRPVQSGQLSGLVADSLGNFLEGATVTLARTKFSTAAKRNGIFTFSKVPFGRYNLMVTYLGYEKLNVTVEIERPDVKVRLVMRAGLSSLDQVKVIAFGSTTQRINVGSVSTVRKDEIAQQPVSGFLQALEGRVPGLTIMTTNGAPGSMTIGQIRGQNTLANAVASKSLPININQPLYILDGVPLASQNQVITDFGLNNGPGANLLKNSGGLSPLNVINPMDIESISILKDADATSIYGSQGSNGVILITTKKGKPGRVALQAVIQSGPTSASRTVEMMNTRQYIEMRKEALANSGQQASLPKDADLLLFDPASYKEYVKQFFGGMGHRTDVNIGVSGGSESFTYLINAAGTNNSYNFPGGFADKRFTAHSSFNHQSADKQFSLEFGTDYSHDKNSSSGSPAVLSAFTLPPNMPDLLDAKGNLVWNYKGYSFANNDLGNPLAFLKQTAYSALSNLNMHMLATYQVISSLKIVLSAGYNRLSDDNYAVFPFSTQNPAFGVLGYANSGNGYFETVNIEPQLKYNRRIGRGVLSLLLGGTYRKNSTKSESVFVYGYENDAKTGGSSPVVSNQSSLYKYAAGFARINYIWANKYIFNFTVNRDGSSNFGPDRRFGTFGSAGLGWIVTEERFLKDIGFLSFAKLSGNYGISGSDGVAPYQYQPNWASVISLNGYQGIKGYYPVNPQNSSYAWALNKKLNVSVELGFLDNRVLLNITAYKNKASDQLVAYNQPIQTGFDDVTANAPYVVENRGFEFSIESKNITGGKFKWSSGFNIYHNANRIVKFPDLLSSPYKYTYVLGKSVNAVPLIPYIGVDPATGVFSYRKADGSVTSNPNVSPGFNNVGGDLTALVNLDPKFTGGFINTFTYKTFSLSVFFQFAKQVGPNYLYNIYGNSLIPIPGAPNTNEPAILLSRWRKPGDMALYQRFSAGLYTAVDRLAENAARALVSSTGAYSDASFIRLKTVSLSYDLPITPRIKRYIKRCAVFVHGQNIFLITPYKLADPETQYFYSIPPQRTIVFGFEMNI